MIDVMDSHTLKVLEYEKIRELLLKHASCELGKERVRAMAPLTNINEVEQRLAETTEARMVLEEQGSVPLGGIHDVRAAVDRARRDGILQPGELLDIADTIAAGRRLKFFFARYRSRYPLLNTLSLEIQDFNALENDIRRAISDHAEVLDSASPELAHIRNSMRQTQTRLQERLDQILHSAVYEKMLQDPVLVRRNDRLCIPVKSEYRSAFNGLVHDTSASGATVFMEPAIALQMQNDLRELEAAERHEIERILTELSHLVRRRAEELLATQKALGLMDFIHAKARLSLAQQATAPKLNTNGIVDLREARHPLLQGAVVPIDLHLGKTFNTLVITGPNTGGKTVTLKTLGLLTLMAQSGLHVPAKDGSELAIFRQLFADIGDEQSIEQSLSTFSAHITQIVKIVRRLGRNALVLLDEIGAGTDPTEGAALARALLDHLTAHHARTVATTHYSELKQYAYAQPETENGSVEFDIQSLQPTYRLLIGIPGSSNALTIARRLGLPRDIVAQAESSLNPEHREVEGLIQRIEADARKARSERESAAAVSEDAEKIRRRLSQEMEKLRQQRDAALADAAAEAAAVVQKAQAEAREILARLRSQTRENRETNDASQALKALASEVNAQALRTAPAKPAAQPAAETLETLDRQAQVGDQVVVQSFGGRGTVIERSGDAQEALVQVGAMRLTVPLGDLRVVHSRHPLPPARPTLPPPAASNGLVAKSAQFAPELHLRGKLVEDALMELDKYLDDAVLTGMDAVRVIHGKGTGALRNAIWDYLRGNPNVSGYHHPEPQEGGAGVTVVELKGN